MSAVPSVVSTDMDAVYPLAPKMYPLASLVGGAVPSNPTPLDCPSQLANCGHGSVHAEADPWIDMPGAIRRTPRDACAHALRWPSQLPAAADPTPLCGPVRPIRRPSQARRAHLGRAEDGDVPERHRLVQLDVALVVEQQH
eukprot:CAMPEP_0118942710 /NCGR_PEP_ID=MMETSP1169-20130426/36703_1 /TAXON_ID=36882 /ORGANISM="Pyramimonas obovata, Strain CCMP722" /LENGTH=140 /DNA_ID=CAMNT_0006887775 /DNA_START=248 /DNA_END=667 /DNA_ORIENTATION=+